MDVHLSVSSIIILCFFLTILPPSYCDEDDRFAVCNRTYTCGSVNISYPFWGGGRPEYCGHQGYELSCIDNKYPVIRIEALEFVVLNINPSNRSFTIARSDLLLYGPCPPKLLNTTLNYTLFDYTPNDQNMTIFHGCPPQDLEYNGIPIPNRINCIQLGVPDGKLNAYIVDQSNLSGKLPHLMEECENSIKVPILKSSATALLADPNGGVPAVYLAMGKGFEVEYYSNEYLAFACTTCVESGGVCGSNSTQPSQFLCFCGDQLQERSSSCNPPKPAVCREC